MEQGRKRRRKVETTGKKAVFTAVLTAGVVAAGIVAAGPWVASAHAANTVTIMKPVYYEKSTSGLTLLDQSPATDDNGVITLDVAQHMAVVTSGLTVNLSNPTIASAALNGTVLTLTPLTAGTTEVTISGTGAGGVVYSDKIQLQLVKIGDSTGDGLVTSADALYIYKIVNGQVQISDAEKNLLDIDRDGAVTSKDASLLMSTYVGKPGSASETKMIVNLSEVNDSPFVYGVAAPTTAVSGQTVTGIYHYVDMEGDVEASEYQWYVGSRADGTDREPISGATRLTYTVRQQDESKYLFFGVRPVAAAGRNDTQMVISSAGVQVPDTTAPTLTSSTPANQATVASKSDSVVLTFSESVKAAASKHVRVRRVADDVAVIDYLTTDTAHVTIQDKTVTIANPGIADATGYYVEVETGAFTDLSNNAYAGITSKIALTFSIPDITAPTVTTLSPQNGVTIQQLSPTLIFTFNENVQAAAGKAITVRRASDDTAEATYQADDTAHVTINGGQVAIHDANLTFTEQTGYYLEVDGGAFTDAALNPTPAISGRTAWAFITADLTAPTLTSSTPANQATVESKTDPVVLSFSESMKAAASKHVRVKRVADDVTVIDYLTTDTAHVTIQDKIVTIANPGIADATSYYVEVEAGAFTDLSNNAYAGITSKTALTFSIPDITAPTVTTLSPQNGVTIQQLHPTLIFTFNENVQAAAGKAITVRRASDDTAEATYQADDTAHVTINGGQVSIQDASLNLAEQTGYYIEIDSGAFTDVALNPAPAITDRTAWSFITADLTAPTLTGSTPANQATVASKNDPVVLTFSESMKAAASKHVRVKSVADDVAVIDYLTTDTAHVTIQDKTVTIANPGIADGTGYYVEVEAGAFTDLSNNAYAGITSKTALTFSIPDITAPTVTTLSPQNGSSTMNSAAELTLTFSEPVQAVAGKTVAFYKTSDDAIPVATYQADDTTKVVISGGGKTVTLANPGLESLQSYYITVDGGAFLDSANLPFAGLTGKTAWAFTTISNLSATAVPDVPIDELNLSTGASLTVTINGDTFKDSLSDTDFTLNNAPPGTIIALAGKYSDTTAFILLDFDKTYFAADYSNITVTVKGSGLTGGLNIESSEFAIQAVQPMTVPTLVPANGSTVNSLQAPFSMTFSSNVTAVAGKVIKLYRASDNSLVETIQVNDSTKVKITGNTVTIYHQALTASTPYYMTVDAWAFENAQSVPSPAISGSTAWRMTTGALSTIGYISDFVIGSNGRSAIQVYSNDNGMAGMQTGYELFFYRYVQATHTVQTFSLPFLPYYPGMPYIVLNSNFYDFFDITKAYYFNEEAYFDLAGYTLNAIVLKKDGGVVDVVGDPNATTPKPILPNGGTLVRRQGTMAGSTVYNMNEWMEYPKDTFLYLGSHQP